MNIMQYRQIKAEQASAPAPTQPATQPIITQPVVETKPIETPPVEVTQTVPEKVVIEGIGEVPFDELKRGYLRQSDYTQKTQDVARQKKEVQEAVSFYETVKQNPELLKAIPPTAQVPSSLDPATAKVRELENLVYDMKLQTEISTLQGKYKDFEIREVLEVAQEKQLMNLEDAYFIAKSRKQVEPVNQTELEKQIREKLIKEIEAERNATQTIISGQPSAVIKTDEPVLNDAERKVARMMRLSEAEYAVWRDAGNKKK